MNDPKFKFPDKASYKFVTDYFESKGVKADDIASITYNIQQRYIPNLEMSEVRAAVIDVLHKREVLNNAMVGIVLDQFASRRQLPEPLQSIVENDSGVFGVDELLAEGGISGIYGKIATTNFGYLDKEKHGILKRLDHPTDGNVNTFLDDIIAAVAAAAGAKIAHAHA
ncbi:MAG: phosphatidylglycerophosphatase A [Liquorilactobacillus ghanensis]|jgi:phosphatidylglycerophosphatase A|uniref:Phosphatidylglycerophosphatase A n=1 Tax=Liquorilactobacillus ghanensis DSM 18630 TaxID=1423750 RepID=A0A0R1VLI3_9LACO|nr:phosphatidylglycerophosphatase A [Liquorilactobacillus ghanensis]KRM06197.1 phosphatidylglycerophosphatase A [Liquorilactobacillus ghanensis DSM 18630]